jgi:VWFA-related protein
MSIEPHRRFFLLVAFLATVMVSAQQDSPPQKPVSSRIFLDVVVTPKSGQPVRDLLEQDFTILDNGAQQKIASFQAVEGSHSPVDVILLIDAVNAGYSILSFEREQVGQFLRANGGHLAQPTSLAILTGTGTQIQEGFSVDGNTLSASLEQYDMDLRNTPRSASFYGQAERYQLSLKALEELAVRETPRPGRKIMIWVSPGWPILTGHSITMDDKQQQHIFGNVVGFSNLLRRGRITLYSIDPLGAGDAAVRTLYWKDYVKGISKPSQVEAGNLALEVLATQSGGLVLNDNNDVAALVRECLADTSAFYEISFDAPVGDPPHKYHHLEVRLAKPGLIARTRQGYYSQP